RRDGSDRNGSDRKSRSVGAATRLFRPRGADRHPGAVGGVQATSLVFGNAGPAFVQPVTAMRARNAPDAVQLTLLRALRPTAHATARARAPRRYGCGRLRRAARAPPPPPRGRR